MYCIHYKIIGIKLTFPPKKYVLLFSYELYFPTQQTKKTEKMVKTFKSLTYFQRKYFVSFFIIISVILFCIFVILINLDVLWNLKVKYKNINDVIKADTYQVILVSIRWEHKMFFLIQIHLWKMKLTLIRIGMNNTLFTLHRFDRKSDNYVLVMRIVQSVA